MGYIYGRTESYAIGLMLLSATAALTLLLTVTVVRRTANRAVPSRPSPSTSISKGTA
jgi:NNP family nitrate/nitrite transporter-like MFS transporter